MKVAVVDKAVDNSVNKAVDNSVDKKGRTVDNSVDMAVDKIFGILILKKEISPLVLSEENPLQILTNQYNAHIFSTVALSKSPYS